MAKITLKGNPFQTIGSLPEVGNSAPALRLTNADLNDVGLDAFAGQRKVLTINPSFDTPVCATSARKFNERASSLANTVVLAISADLPSVIVVVGEASLIVERSEQAVVERVLPTIGMPALPSEASIEAL